MRLVLSAEGTLVVGNGAGRGAYVHRGSECAEAAAPGAISAQAVTTSTPIVALFPGLAGRTVPGSNAAIHCLVMTGSPYRYGWRRHPQDLSDW